METYIAMVSFVQLTQFYHQNISVQHLGLILRQTCLTVLQFLDKMCSRQISVGNENDERNSRWFQKGEIYRVFCSRMLLSELGYNNSQKQVKFRVFYIIMLTIASNIQLKSLK